MSEDVCINVEGVSQPILCGLCKQKVAFIGEADADGGDVGCVECGNIADVEKVASMAVDYAKDELQLMLNRMARDTARNSKIMTFSGQTEHNKPYRFIVNSSDEAFMGIRYHTMDGIIIP